MAEKSGKRKRKKHPSSKKYKMYTIQGDKVIRKRMCPRCGPGIFLAVAPNRVFCGKCAYTEFNSSNSSATAVKHEHKK